MRQFVGTICLFLTLLALSGCFHSTHEAQRWTLQPDGVTSFSLSRDGRFALMASTEKGIVLWDLIQNKQLADFGYQDPDKNTVIASQISDNNRYAISATSQNFAVWDLAWGQAEGLWSISDGIIRGLDISNNGQKVLLALSNGKALFVDLGTGRRLEFLAHKDKVNSVSLSPNGKYAMSGGNDHNAFFWDTETGQILNQFTHEHRITRVELHRNGKFAFSADGDDAAIVWDLSTGDAISELQMFQRHANFSTARFSDDGTRLVTGTPGRRVEYWDTQTGDNVGRWLAREQQNTRPPTAVVYDVAIDPTGRVISGTSAGIAQAWIAQEN
ncbi:WD40 repeat domain-containing protein [Enterovibrio sp. 27052020O]|uniref:WD40 repeat domain-containing protein n=1 Tax=Enterovibrio sp. 27052020O TaxID=3241166 RepID=UPI00388F1FE6